MPRLVLGIQGLEARLPAAKTSAGGMEDVPVLRESQARFPGKFNR
jgi:hypothetical protein